MRLYQSYVFKEKDPVIDELRTMVQDTFQGLNHSALSRIEKSGGPTSSCMAGWFFGDIRRPQSATIEACGRALGMRRVWQPLAAREIAAIKERAEKAAKSKTSKKRAKK